jgi:PTH1 family peptidyl-tRNA hydrolase
MYYIVALGNPGEQYARTRHNVGWVALDCALQAWGLPSVVAQRPVFGRVTDGVVAGVPVAVLYPDTFMNNSGSAVVKFVPPDEITHLIVVHDDIDLPLGEVKVSKGRGAGGNNGVASIIATLGSKEFVRVRIGIAPKSVLTGAVKRPAGGGPLERFVLKPFSLLEQRQLPAVYEKARLALELIVSEGVEEAMNRCN